MKSPNFLTGLGQDSHKFEEEKTPKSLMLGGYEIPDHIALEGNSDADVILHSIFNALSLAVGKRSLGHYSDPICEKGITDSSEYLKIAMKLVDRAGYKISNITLMLECQTPNIEKHQDKIKFSISNILNLPTERIGLAGTTGEKLTDFGKGKGIQCLCNVLLEKKPTAFYKKPIFIFTIIIVSLYIYGLYWAMESLGL